MSNNTVISKDLIGVRVVGGKTGDKRIGKVRHIVFHPKERRVVGLVVKRPDLALMFHRKDLFVALDSFEMVDGRICVSDRKDAVDNAACKRMGIEWDECVLWSGMSIVTESGASVGTVGTVSFNGLTGKVIAVVADRGATSKALLGTLEIPVEEIRGFRFGIGERIAEMGREGESVEEDGEQLGAILVSDAVLNIGLEGGLAEKAGQAVGKAKPVVHEAAHKAGEAVNKGAQALGEQVGKTKGMFAGFKEEYDKAVREEPASSAALEAGDDVDAVKSSDSKPVTKPAAAAKKASSGDTVAKSIGKQIGKSKGMFAAFKEEYDKARNE